ncbi:hypothetical protein B0T16DRAFT_490556, partial [Cercophora newfieldiana]
MNTCAISVSGENMSLGDLIVRRFTVHDLQHFTIEQRVSVEMIHHTRRWTMLIWMDSGSDLSLTGNGPWLQNDKKLAWAATLDPVFQHRSRMALENTTNHIQSGTSRLPAVSPDKSKTLPQTISQMHLNYGRYLHPEIMACDAFYTLNELFQFSATSRGQFLDIMEDKIRIFSESRTNYRQQFEGIAELQLTRSLLEDHAREVEDNLDAIRSRDASTWPKATESSLLVKAEKAALQLQHQYERLLRRYRQLIEQCSISASALTNQQAHNHAEKTIQQANAITKLTLLAFCFVPLSFTTSLF